jgi:hypothetical protein
MNYSKRTRKRIIAYCSTLLLFLVAGCETSIFDPPPVQIPNGEYRGSYSLLRSNPNDRNPQGTTYSESQVAFIINSSSLTYRIIPQGDTLSPPASEGSYSLRYTRITLRDRTNRTFADPSLVLNGDFTYTFDGTSLILSQKDTVRKREHTLVLMRF